LIYKNQELEQEIERLQSNYNQLLTTSTSEKETSAYRISVLE